MAFIHSSAGKGNVYQLDPQRKKQIMFTLGAMAIWTIPGLIQASQEVYYAKITGGSYGSLWRLVAQMVPRWYLWVIAMPFVMKAARRWRPDASNWRWVLPLHALLATLTASVVIVLIIFYGLNVHIWGQVMPFMGQLKFALWSMIPHVHFMAYWAICALTWIFDGQRAIRDREIRTARLESQLAGAKLDALQMQLRPHFLFNTLNSISVLMEEDVAASRQMLQKLSGLLRRTLSMGNQQRVTVATEFEYISEYLDIEQIRFADRLTVHINMSPETEHLSMPALLMQPLVENALKHGVGSKPGPARLEVKSQLEMGKLCLEVLDDGVGWDGTGTQRVGMNNTRARLQQMYGNQHTLSVNKLSIGGTSIRITIPAKENSDD